MVPKLQTIPKAAVWREVCAGQGHCLLLWLRIQQLQKLKGVCAQQLRCHLQELQRGRLSRILQMVPQAWTRPEGALWLDGPRSSAP